MSASGNRRSPQRLRTRELLDLLVDAGSYRSWDALLDVHPPVPHVDAESYATQLAKARAASGSDESVLTGAGKIRGFEVAIVAGDFEFLAGSIGVVAGERLVAAIDRARRRRLPLLALPVSGGTRMQEGTVAFLQMLKVAGAVQTFRASGLPYIVYLRHPTTGGTLASWASLGQVTLGEPGALVGFLGPRVYEALAGEPFPPGVQVSENLVASGVIDAVVAPAELADVVARVIAVAGPTSRAPGPAPTPVELPEPPAGTDAWRSVERSRDPRRPGLRELLAAAGQGLTQLHGTAEGEPDGSAVLVGLVRLTGVPVVLLGQDRAAQRAGAPLGPAALRKARRGMRLAARLRLPLVTVIDTPGAELSRAAEEGALAGEIARCLMDLTTLTVPVLSLLLGEGTGGGALALLPADRVICAEHGWLSPLPPEGASVILHRTPDRAPELARWQGIASWDLRRADIVDRIIPEGTTAADDPEVFLRRTAGVLAVELRGLVAQDAHTLVLNRMRRWRDVGTLSA